MADLGFQVQFVPGWLVRLLPLFRRAFVFHGFRRRPTIYIPASRASDNSWMSLTLAHEVIHVQQWTHLGRFGFLRRYLTKAGRLRLEAEAYAASVEWYHEQGTQFHPGDDPLRRKGTSLATLYRLDISIADAMKEIEKWL